MCGISQLYLIACSGKKVGPGQGPAWQEARNHDGWNKFQCLDEERNDLLNFYSRLTRGEADSVYVAPRGLKTQSSRNIENAWVKNLTLKSCPTMRAVDRYDGTVYQILGKKLSEGLSSSSNSILLIISSLFGILHPNDMIPDYELMMKDRSPYNTAVYKWWSDIFERRRLSTILEERYSGLKNIYCFLSRTSGYIDAVRILGEKFMTYIVSVENGSTGGSTRAWGNSLKLCLEESPSNPDEIARIVEREGCKLIQLKG